MSFSDNLPSDSERNMILPSTFRQTLSVQKKTGFARNTTIKMHFVLTLNYILLFLALKAIFVHSGLQAVLGFFAV
jgi:hypothetical protein